MSRSLLPDPACLIRHHRYALTNACAFIVRCRDRCLDRAAWSFYKALIDGGANRTAHIDVLPRHALIYVSVPKCASSTIKTILSALHRNRADLPEVPHNRRFTGLRSPKQIGASAFYRLAQSPATLRFAFVRNPYARLVSAWADKYRGKALVAGDSFVDTYLEHRPEIDRSLPEGPGTTLSFGDFAKFAVATAGRRLNSHWQLQDDLLEIPGIRLDFIGRVETFSADFSRVLDHVGAGEQLRQAIHLRRNMTAHQPWQDYYSAGLADMVYRAYERDFSRFGYSRVPHGALGGALKRDHPTMVPL